MRSTASTPPSHQEYLLITTFPDIKTYAVTPLNEECGLIEWVDNLRTLRELVLKLLRERGIIPNVCAFQLFFLSAVRCVTIN